ncbi:MULTISPECIES: hypothetical protein [unclassified Clostridium]|uniref:hypothetical protein n=1 Tax=unclassified Clostridium TaxID=2614128 RepID=UPI000297DB95|nr:MULTISPECIES: hypothetical protein [unclassified Clostridium]EKQ56310.1 MAG: hypothetical protein A370_02066 [Clostridium sp. Maddingley MBC34-26]
MNLEDKLKDCISNELEKGVIEKVIAAKLEECVGKAVEGLFSYGGEVKKVIEGKVKDVMIPYLENYDYSQYLLKLDNVLVEVLKNSALDNKKLLENFKELMTNEEIPKLIKMSDIFNEWKKYAAKEVDTSELEEDCGEYEYLEVRMSCEDVSSSWSDYEKYMVTFECEQDEKLNFEFEISRWKKSNKKTFDLHYYEKHDLESLRYLKSFEIYMMKIKQAFCDIDLDNENDSDEVEVEAKPYD